MPQSLVRPFGVPNHRFVTPVERDMFASELRQCLVAHTSNDPKLQQKKKDLTKGLNRAPETLADFLCDSYNVDRPIAERILATIRGFFSVRANTVRRKWRDLRAAETKIEGEMNCTELELDHGDWSRGRVLEMKDRIHAYREILDEEEAALDQKLFSQAS